MSTDYLISLIQRKYTLVGLEKSVVNSIFNGDLKRPSELFITNTKRASGVYRGWGINATNFFRFLNCWLSSRKGRLQYSKTLKGIRL